MSSSATEVHSDIFLMLHEKLCHGFQECVKLEHEDYLLTPPLSFDAKNATVFSWISLTFKATGT